MAAVSAAAWPRPGATELPHALPPIFTHGSRDYPDLALTFDDCYLIQALQHLEALLDEWPQARVTFFPVGTALLNTARQDAGIWPRLYARGHEIGYHTYDHQQPSELTTKELMRDYDRWLAAATLVLGETPRVRLARPPYRDRSRSFLNLCVERGLVMAMWSADWSSAWGGDAQRGLREMDRVQNGDVVLLHIRTLDIERVREALALPHVAAQRLVTVSRLKALAERADGPSSRQ